MKSLLVVLAALYSMNASAEFEVSRVVEVPEVAATEIVKDVMKQEVSEADSIPGSGLVWDGAAILTKHKAMSDSVSMNTEPPAEVYSLHQKNVMYMAKCNPGKGLVLNGNVMMNTTPVKEIYSLHQQLVMYR
jgi:hypothetical protein